MSIREVKRPNQEAAREAVLELLDAGSGLPVDNAQVFLLVPHFANTVYLKKLLAQKGRALGVEVNTASSWVRDQWELWGDGRRLISSQLRRTIIAKLLSEHQEQSEQPLLPATPGVIELVEELVQGYLPYLEENPRLNPAEKAVIACSHDYAQLIDSMGYCEVSQAATLLPSKMKLPAAIVLTGYYWDELPYHLRLLFDELGVTLIKNTQDSPTPQQRTQELTELQSRLFKPTPEDPVTPEEAVKFCFAAGPSAQAQLITNVLVEVHTEKRENTKRSAKTTLVTSKNPLSLFSQVAPRLKEQGIDSSCSARKNLAETDAGREVMQLLELLSMEVDAAPLEADITPPSTLINTFLATDYALNPLSGLTNKQAYAGDYRWRKNRLVTPSSILSDLQSDTPETLKGVIGDLQNNNATEALTKLKSWVFSKQD